MGLCYFRWDIATLCKICIYLFFSVRIFFSEHQNLGAHTSKAVSLWKHCRKPHASLDQLLHIFFYPHIHTIVFATQESCLHVLLLGIFLSFLSSSLSSFITCTFDIISWAHTEKTSIISVLLQKYKESNEKNTFSKIINQKIFKIKASSVFQPKYQSITIMISNINLHSEVPQPAFCGTFWLLLRLFGYLVQIKSKQNTQKTGFTEQNLSVLSPKNETCILGCSI